MVRMSSIVFGASGAQSGADRLLSAAKVLRESRLETEGDVDALIAAIDALRESPRPLVGAPETAGASDDALDDLRAQLAASVADPSLRSTARALATGIAQHLETEAHAMLSKHAPAPVTQALRPGDGNQRNAGDVLQDAVKQLAVGLAFAAGKHVVTSAWNLAKKRSSKKGAASVELTANFTAGNTMEGVVFDVLWFLHTVAHASFRAFKTVAGLTYPDDVTAVRVADDVFVDVSSSKATFSPTQTHVAYETLSISVRVWSSKGTVEDVGLFIAACGQKRRTHVDARLQPQSHSAAPKSERMFVHDMFVKAPQAGYANQGLTFGFTKKPLDTFRTFENLYLNRDAQALLLRRLDRFLNRRAFYQKNGIPYRFGVMLWGPPGTGKTSTIKAIANYTGRHIFNVPLDKIPNVSVLKGIFESEVISTIVDDNYSNARVPMDRRLYVLEDVDAMESVVRLRTAEVSGEKELPYTLTDLLNVLDGNVETPGRMLVMTTNHPDHLDPAFIRDGRVDLKVELGAMESDALARMLDALCDDGVSSDGSDLEGVHKKLTPARAMGIILNAECERQPSIAALIAAADGPENAWEASHDDAVTEVDASPDGSVNEM